MESWEIAQANINEYKNILFVAKSFFSRELVQRPCKKRKSETKAIPNPVIKIFALIEIMASKRRKAVRSVRTKPTPRAARTKAMVLIAETVNMLAVRQRL